VRQWPVRRIAGEAQFFDDLWSPWIHFLGRMTVIAANGVHQTLTALYLLKRVSAVTPGRCCRCIVTAYVGAGADSDQEHKKRKQSFCIKGV
jgi:hypothetical protein